MRGLLIGATILASLLAAPAFAQSELERTLKHQGVDRHYVLHLPSGAPDAAPRPLVLALHGLDSEGNSGQAVR